MFKFYPRAEESLLGFLVCCHKSGTECLMCPRYAVVYDQMMFEDFEGIPFAPCWNHQDKNPLNPNFGARSSQRRLDSPYPRAAQRVTFKLPVEVPTDRWLQEKADREKGKWRSYDQGGRTAMAYRKNSRFRKGKTLGWRITKVVLM